MSRALVFAALAAIAFAATAAENPDVVRLNQRLAALQADPQLGELAPYERIQARQAVDAFAKAKRKLREEFLYLAEKRVEIAETAARTAAAKRELDELDDVRRDLMVEASRQDAARARRERTPAHPGADPGRGGRTPAPGRRSRGAGPARGRRHPDRGRRPADGKTVGGAAQGGAAGA